MGIALQLRFVLIIFKNLIWLLSSHYFSQFSCAINLVALQTSTALSASAAVGVIFVNKNRGWRGRYGQGNSLLCLPPPVFPKAVVKYKPHFLFLLAHHIKFHIFERHFFKYRLHKQRISGIAFSDSQRHIVHFIDQSCIVLHFQHILSELIDTSYVLLLAGLYCAGLAEKSALELLKRFSSIVG